MGRGRQKAKQTKVARELKYHSETIDVDALRRELSGEPGSPPPAKIDGVDDEFEPYAVDDDDDGPVGRYAIRR